MARGSGPGAAHPQCEQPVDLPVDDRNVDRQRLTRPCERAPGAWSRFRRVDAVDDALGRCRVEFDVQSRSAGVEAGPARSHLQTPRAAPQRGRVRRRESRAGPRREGPDRAPDTSRRRQSAGTPSRCVTSRRIVRRLSSRNATMSRASAKGCSRGTIATSRPKTSFSSRPPGLSAETTGVPARQRFHGDGRQRLEQRGQDEEIGGGAVAGHDAIIHEAGEGHVTLHTRGPRDGLQFVEQRAGAADHEPRVRMRRGSLRSSPRCR